MKSKLIFLISVIFVLFVYGVPVYATTVADADIAAIADKISSSIKTEITATLKQEKQAIINKVETELKSRNIDGTLIKNIIDSLNANDLLTTGNDDVIAATIKTTITDMLKQNAGIDKKFEKINERIENLEAAKQPKMLAPYKDVDFLFEDVIGDAYDAADYKEKLIKVGNKSIQKIKITTHLFKGDEVSLTFDDGNPTKVDNKDLAPMVIEAKMQAVEHTLKITPQPNDTLKTRIARAYTEVNNKDWQNDDLRFGILTSYLTNVHAVATSIALHGYLGYRRFTPGFTLNNWGNLRNIGRRFSLFFAVGTGSASGDTDIKSPILSAGVGFDIVKGFALSAGYSVFSYKEKTTDTDYKSKGSLAFGVTLNSDLWRVLFNNK